MNAVTLNLDIQFPDRMYELKFAVGTQPLVRVYLKANGTAVTTTGYTGQMVFAEFKDSESAVYIDSTATGSNYIDFQLTATETLQISSGTEEYFLQFLVTDGSGNTAEWNRGKLFLRASPGTDGADVATLGSSINWANYSSYANTGASGPVRAGTNITAANNADGSITLSAAAASVADGSVTPAKLANADFGDFTVASGVATIDAGAVNAGKLASDAVTTAKILDANVTAAKLASDSVTTAKIADDAVTAAKLADTAVTAGSYGPTTLTVDAQGRLTAASTSSSAAIQSALGSVYLPLTGGTLTGAITVDGDDVFITNGGNLSVVGGIVSGSGSGLTSVPAAQLTGDIPAASFGEVFAEWTDRSFHLHTSAEVGWAAPFDIDTGTRTISADAVSSANTSAQSFTLRSDVKRLPRGFVAFKTTGALTIDWVADDTAVADITGIELIGYSDITGSKTSLYSDATTRNVGTINVPITISIDRSAFSSTTVPTHILLEITGTIEDGKKLGIIHAEVFGE